MKKTTLICLIAVLTAFTATAQSKLSYSLLTNTSGALDDQFDICILETTGGNCYDLEKTWKVNFTASLNYQASNRLRLQTGLGYNVFHMKDLNESLNTSRYQLNYLSIPMKAHYFISNGKARFYIGGGFRTDIRLNKQSPVRAGALVQDNASGLALSLETLIGIEFNVLPMLSLGIEPTFATAISSYRRDLDFDGSSSFAPNATAQSYLLLNFIEEKPKRLGMTLSVNYTLK